MKICVVGTGTSGWFTAFSLSKINGVEITIIGSPSIPTIGVGESTTLTFFEFLTEIFSLKNNNDYSEEYFNFLKETDASIKYGVNYEGWSNNNKRFLNGFGGGLDGGFNLEKNYLLGKLDEYVDFNLIYPLGNYIYNNFISTNHKIQPFTFQFDANKLINFFEKKSKEISNIKFIKNTVTGSSFKGEDVDYLVLENGEKITADYYISCIGQTAFNQKIFKEEYISYSDVLLTDKALFLPLKYSNKRDQFHPYTTARTLNCGWRWITPTYSRIGTGYVFSSRHISTGEAIDELRKNIGDNSVEPNIVDFFPRKVKNVFKNNFCTIGLAAGFLEPLDAPGLSAVFLTLKLLKNNLIAIKNTYFNFNEFNKIMDDNYNFWCSFILHQYKTSSRNDTKFWIDHKNVRFNFYENLIDCYFNKVEHPKDMFEKVSEAYLFFNTSAGKSLRWKVSDSCKNQSPKLHFITNKEVLKSSIINHLDYFDNIHSNF